MTAHLTPVFVLTPPPPAPDRGRRAVLLALLLTAALTIALPPPFARAAPSSGVAPAAGGMPFPGVAPSAGVMPSSGVVSSSGVAARPGTGAGRAWPVGDRSGLLQRFAAPQARWAPGHRGVDLAAAPRTAVRAAAAGVVSFSGVVAGRAVVTVTHPGSGSPPLRTTYLPVEGTLPVGTTVSAGQVIGEVADGSGHCSTGCLHWGLLRGERYLDPLALLGVGQARLLPLDDR